LALAGCTPTNRFLMAFFEHKYRRIVARLERDDGQSMVEFALVLLPLCLVLFGITQFGLAFHHYLKVTDAARVGARAAAVSRAGAATASASIACAAAKKAATDSINDSSVTLAFDCPTGTIAPGTSFPFGVHWPKFNIRVMGIVIRNNVDLKSTVWERME